MSAIEVDNRGDVIERAALEVVLQVSRRLASSSDLSQVLELIIDSLCSTLHADRASVFQYDAERHELFATRAHGLPNDLRLPADRGIVGEAARTREIINIPDAYADPRFNPGVDKSTGYRTRCLLTVPLVDEEKNLVGVAQILNKDEDHGGVFNERDERLAELLAEQAALALKRAALLGIRREQELLRRELSVARDIQTSGLVRTLPVFPGYDIAADTKPADETGGDAYDVIDLRVHAPGKGRGDAAIFLADATGHGIPAALAITQALYMFRMGCRLGATQEEVATQVNAQMCADAVDGRFVTAFFGEFHLAEHRLNYLSAAQAPLLLLRALGSGREDHIVMTPTSCFLALDHPLAIDPAEPFVFGPGDVLALLSDGFFEARSLVSRERGKLMEQGPLLGHERLAEVIREHMHLSAADIVKALQAEVLRFVGMDKRKDDQTAVIMKRVS